MKSFWSGIRKSLMYFALFLAVQTLAAIPIILMNMESIAYDIGYQVGKTGEPMNPDMVIDNIIGALNNYTYWYLLISSILTLVILAVVFFARRKDLMKEIYMNTFQFKSIFPVLLIAISVQILSSTITSILPVPQALVDSFANNVRSVSDEISFLSLITIGLLVPITEEVVFRGLIFSRLRLGMPIYIAVIIQAALFGLVHTGIIWRVAAFVMGIVFALIALKLGSIIPSIVAHMVANILSVLSNVLMPDGLVVGLPLFVISTIIFGLSMFIMIKKATPNVIVEGAVIEEH